MEDTIEMHYQQFGISINISKEALKVIRTASYAQVRQIGHLVHATIVLRETCKSTIKTIGH